MTHRWNDAAETRKRQIESGIDLTFSKVFVPYFQRKISELKPKRVLEIGGGTGHLAAVLSSAVEHYVMIEPSPGMFAVATHVLLATDVELHNCTIEVFKNPASFDLVLSHMCIQTVANSDMFLLSSARHVHARGKLLLSLPHPAFYNEYKKFFDPQTFRYIRQRSGTVNFSITLDPEEVIQGVPYHHRPVSEYISSFSSAGLCVSSLDEIYPSQEIQSLYGQNWENPRYMVIGGIRH